MTLEFLPADLNEDRDTLIRLNIEYVNWVADGVEDVFGLCLADVLGSPIPAYVEEALDKICEGEPPQSIFYLVRHEGVVVGMGGLRTVKPGIAEMKRIYVLPTARGMNLGAKIAARLIEDAKSFGNSEMWLDTGPFMGSAHRLYETLGFVDIPAYPEAEVPEALRHQWRFMRRTL